MIIQLKKIMGILVVAFTVFASFHLASAQQANSIFRIGFLGQGKPIMYKNRIKALQQGLIEFGYFEGQNMRFEYRYVPNVPRCSLQRKNRLTPNCRQ